MDCTEVKDKLADYLDEEALQELCRAIEEHLSHCRDCKVEVDTVRKTIVLYQSDSELKTPGTIKRVFLQPRSSTPPTAGRSESTTLQPVSPTGSVAWPTRMPGTSVIMDQAVRGTRLTWAALTRPSATSEAKARPRSASPRAKGKWRGERSRSSRARAVARHTRPSRSRAVTS